MGENSGGIKIDEKTVKNIFQEYKIFNADVLFREDCGVRKLLITINYWGGKIDDMIDVIEGNRKFVKCLYVYNKIDQIGLEDVDEIARK